MGLKVVVLVVGIRVDERALTMVAFTLNTLVQGEGDALDVQVMALGTGDHRGGVDVELGHRRQQLVSGWIIVGEVGEDVARLLPIGFLVIHLGEETPRITERTIVATSRGYTLDKGRRRQRRGGRVGKERVYHNARNTVGSIFSQCVNNMGWGQGEKKKIRIKRRGKQLQ